MKKLNIKTFKNFLYLLKEFYYSNRYTYNVQKKKVLIYKLEEKRKSKLKLDIYEYLDQYKPISEINIKDDNKNFENENFIVKLSNTIFDDVKIRVNNNKVQNKKVLIYLHGYKSGADDVISNNKHPEYLLDFAKKNQLTLVTWDWPLHGERLNRCLFENINSIYSAEKQYSKILNLMGSSLFIEYINEYKFILNTLTDIFKDKKIINVGYSMGGFFSYFSSILNSNIYKIISISSFSSYSNILNDEKIQLNGQFYYPYNATTFFEMDDIIISAIKKNIQSLHIIFGDKDPNCNIEMKNNFNIKNMSIKVLKNHGQEFSKDTLRLLQDAI